MPGYRGTKSTHWVAVNSSESCTLLYSQHVQYMLLESGYRTLSSKVHDPQTRSSSVLNRPHFPAIYPDQFPSSTLKSRPSSLRVLKTSNPTTLSFQQPARTQPPPHAPHLNVLPRLASPRPSFLPLPSPQHSHHQK